MAPNLKKTIQNFAMPSFSQSFTIVRLEIVGCIVYINNVGSGISNSHHIPGNKNMFYVLLCFLIFFNFLCYDFEKFPSL